MKKLLTTTLTLALMMPVAPLWAGDEAKRICPEDPATCARTMKEQFTKRGWVGINMEYDKERGVIAISNVVLRHLRPAASQLNRRSNISQLSTPLKRALTFCR